MVCIKQVPDTKSATGQAMKADGTVNRAALPAIFNPEDTNALEAALRLKDAHGGKVSVIAMGPPAAAEILRHALMCGADDAYLVTDRMAAGSDTLATSYILSKAISRLNPDIVFTGRQAIDGDTAQTGPQIAEKLGFPLVAYVKDISFDGTRLVLERDTDAGTERVSVAPPALVTVTDALGELRPRNMRRVMKYKKSVPKPLCEGGEGPIAALSLQDIGAEYGKCGFAGSPTCVSKIESIVLAGGEYRSFGGDREGIAALVDELRKTHAID